MEVNIRDAANAISAVAPSSIGLCEPTSLFSGISFNSTIQDTTNAISAIVNIHDKAYAISAKADATTIETGSPSSFLPATFAQCLKASVTNTIRDSADAISAEANIRDAAYAISAEADEVNIRDGSNAISAIAPSSIGLSEPTSLFSGSSSSLSY